MNPTVAFFLGMLLGGLGAAALLAKWAAVLYRSIERAGRLIADDERSDEDDWLVGR